MRDINQALNTFCPIAPQSRHAVANRPFQGIPGIEITASGKLFATWYTCPAHDEYGQHSDGAYEGPHNYVVLSESVDGGKTWTETQVVDPAGHVRAYDPTLWLDPLGRLWWFWAQCYSRQDENIFDGRAGVWACIADDPERPVWSAPRRIANGVMMNKPLVLANGEWSFPTAVWADLGGAKVLPELEKERFSSLTISPDQGKTFEYRGGADVPFRCYDEHMCVELSDHTLWMLVRTMYGIGQSFSKDMGKTWTPGWDSLLGGPCSRFFIRRLKSGRLLLINHLPYPEIPNRRWALIAKLSEDDGKTWTGGLMLDDRFGVSYPDGTQASDGSIWIIYDYNRSKGGNILLAHFREDDILAGKPISPDTEFRINVSSLS